MANHVRVTLEIGSKGKKVVAVAPDWPGLARGATTEQAALDRLHTYLPRYAPVAELAGMESAFASIPDIEVVERYPGTGSTDFWGISFAFSSLDQQVMSGATLERNLTVMQACWTFFDDVRGRVSAELQKGPRGGGRCAASGMTSPPGAGRNATVTSSLSTPPTLACGCSSPERASTLG